MSTRHLGRFNTATLGAVYASREPETAVQELRQRAGRDGISLRDMHPRSIFVLDLRPHRVADLTVSGALDAWGLRPVDLPGDDFTRCQEVVAVAARLGAEAIRWGSATGAGHSLALFVEHLFPGSRVEVAREVGLTRDALAALDAGARVTDLVPDLAEVPLLKHHGADLPRASHGLRRHTALDRQPCSLTA